MQPLPQVLSRGVTQKYDAFSGGRGLSELRQSNLLRIGRVGIGIRNGRGPRDPVQVPQEMPNWKRSKMKYGIHGALAQVTERWLLAVDAIEDICS
jgi:hypothetical protein